MTDNEKTCYTCGTEITKAYCEDFPEVCEHWTPKKPQTNFERIKAMDEIELVFFIKKIRLETIEEYEKGCYIRYALDYFGTLSWLRSEVQENDK